MASLVLTGCRSRADKSAVEHFSTKFAKWVIEGNIDSVHSYYPASRGCERFELKNYVRSEVVVTRTEDPGTFFVVLTSKVTITVMLDGDGKLEVFNSKGLFAYDENALNRAKKTGQYVDGLNDIDQFHRMSDKGFDTFLVNKAKAAVTPLMLGNRVTVRNAGFVLDDGECYVPVTNTSDVPVTGAEYKLAYEDKFLDLGYNNSNYKKGVDIKPHETVKFKFTFTKLKDTDNYRIEYLTTEAARATKYYQFTGKEFDEYLATKK